MPEHRIIIVGPGGSGKDHLAKQLREFGFRKAVSCTTRAIRDGEVDGRNYFFLSRAEFMDMVAAGRFREWQAFGKEGEWLYGTLQHEFEDANLFIMTPRGLADLTPEELGACTVVYLNPPEHIRRERLGARADPDDPDRRIEVDRADFGGFTGFTVMITDPLFTALDVLQACWPGEDHGSWRRKPVRDTMPDWPVTESQNNNGPGHPQGEAGSPPAKI